MSGLPGWVGLGQRLNVSPYWPTLFFGCLCLSVCPSLSLGPCCLPICLSASVWVSVFPSLFGPLSSSVWVCPLLSLSLCPPCVSSSCVHSSSDCLTAQIRPLCTVSSPVLGAFVPQTWWCQYWGGRGAPCSRPGYRTFYVVGWCEPPRAQVTTGVRDCVFWASAPLLPGLEGIASIPVPYWFPLCLIQGPGLSQGDCTQA